MFVFQVDPEMRLAVQEALSLMANAFKDLYNSEANESYRKTMEALLMETIDKVLSHFNLFSFIQAQRATEEQRGNNYSVCKN